MILGIYGLQDAGKTLLVEELVRELVSKGLRVSSVKHTSHATTIDTEGKDTWRHWKAGSDPVVFSSSAETSIIVHSGLDARRVAELVMREFAPDVVIIEGLKHGPFPKVAVGSVRRTEGTVLVNPSLERLVDYIESAVKHERALAKLPGLDCGKCGLDCERMAAAIAARKRKLSDCREMAEITVEVSVDGKDIAMGRFASEVLDGTVRGLLGTFKGFVPGKDVEIRLVAKKGRKK